MSAQVYVCFSASYWPEYLQCLKKEIHARTYTQAEINTEIYNPTGLQWGESREKRGGGGISTLRNACQQIIQWLALVGNNAGELVLLNREEREMKAVLWKRIKKK